MDILKIVFPLLRTSERIKVVRTLYIGDKSTCLVRDRGRLLLFFGSIPIPRLMSLETSLHKAWDVYIYTCIIIFVHCTLCTCTGHFNGMCVCLCIHVACKCVVVVVVVCVLSVVHGVTSLHREWDIHCIYPMTCLLCIHVRIILIFSLMCAIGGKTVFVFALYSMYRSL